MLINKKKLFYLVGEFYVVFHSCTGWSIVTTLFTQYTYAFNSSMSAACNVNMADKLVVVEAVVLFVNIIAS